MSVTVAGGIAGQRAGGDLRHQVVVLGEQRLAQRGGVDGQQAADLESLMGVVGPEHVVATISTWFSCRWRRCGRSRRCGWPGRRPSSGHGCAARCRRDSSSPCAGARDQVGTCPIPCPARRIRLPAACGGSRDRPLRQPQLPGQLGHAQTARAPRQQPQDGGGTLDGLHATRHLSSAQRSPGLVYPTSGANDV